MPDHFALLDEARRPWLDPELVKQKFLVRSAEIHPDRLPGASAAEKAPAARRFAALNAAWQCLREPRHRLGHLLELELGACPADAREVPPGALDLFLEVSRLCREADAFLAAKSKTASPLVKAGLFAGGLELTERLNRLQQTIHSRRDELLRELQGMNAAWESAPPPGSPARRAALPLESLEQIHRMFSYIARWTAQLQERLVQLSF